eukprot:TRINITY_DN8606_c0_g2_i1.p1 TRINITY_DN8606_c0_g2~~TRINITY_DN8606_c0_g2_i1.p1  ORF type:complete len:398 (+),score=160.62 TRINITY_DN8606_c0_g2_i1:105-1298(+)
MGGSGEFAPALTAVQRAAAKLEHPPVPKRCVVTGSSGIVGQRVTEMLVERGADHVVAFDIIPPPESHWKHPKIKYVKGDLRDAQSVFEAIEGADCVWHIAAAVGPFHPTQLYMDVNYQGTVNVIDACKKHGCPKLVYASSPSTRFDGKDVDGLTEAQMSKLPRKDYVAEYAKTKALGEIAVSEACCDTLLTTSVAPHQVYGPRDTLFLPNILESAATGKLRVFGKGENRICFSHVDNYSHGLILGERALFKGSPALRGFYVCTDGATHPHPEGYSYFWKTIDEAVLKMGFTSLWEKFHLPVWFMYMLAYLGCVYTWASGNKIKLTPFTVNMLVIHRWFDISAAQKDLKYEPIIPFNRGWEDCLNWFHENWLPKHKAKGASGYGAIAKTSEEKINAQR